jgi:acid phosphatase type 7
MPTPRRLLTLPRAVILALLLLAGSLAARQSADPLAIFLTWQGDPATTMTVDWHTEARIDEPTLQYRVAATGGEWQRASAESLAFPFSSRSIHRVELTGLRPDTEYEFRPASGGDPYRFRTMPATLTRPVRFVAGGDLLNRKEWMEATSRLAATYDPDFALFGGDLAYANGMEGNVERWYDWFDALTRNLITEERRLIPVLAAIGNHEVRGGYYWQDTVAARATLPPYAGDDASRMAIAPYYFRVLASPGQPGYGVVDFGDYLSVVLLDSDHANPVEREQKEWLEETLEEREEVPHVFPIYHVPGYPSVRRYEGNVHRRVREHWVPLFEEHGVRVVFENHDHIYKRTFPLRDGKIAADGVVYLGDGAWGANTREARQDAAGEERPWYTVRTEPVRHFIVATIDGPHQHFLMVDGDGNVFDEYPSTPGRQLHEYDWPEEEAGDDAG